MNTMTPSLLLKKGEARRLLNGHLWIFSNEVAQINGAPQAGDIVDLFDASQQFIGKGFFNPRSLIMFRLLTREREETGLGFWKKKISAAIDYRKTLYPGAQSFRAVFGESDGLPGLIVDKYARYLSVQFLSAGLEKNKNLIVEALNVLLAPGGIVARNDSGLRTLEGLERKTEVLSGALPPRIEIEENGCRFLVDLVAGQKTGFYFDQRENREVFGRYCGGKTVLDVFSHTGAFSMYALKNGAKSVRAVDSSAPALALAEENAKHNGFHERFETVVSDGFDYLVQQKQRPEKFDIIVVDPPALIKSKKHYKAGYRAYVKLNSLALSLLSPGGMLATSSCSHNLSPQDFRDVLKDAASRYARQVRVLELRGQSRDHPVLLSMPETEYLKFALLKV